ncbi:hypothetical protein [Nonomuraea jabiensis]|uniref:SH3 domain-containing protein n=1 Tax=Nonomuraea jabiensis TaxID=882448 RepID=A0A7W9G6M6_9ACTN|nr:hypothetical protein [Nonomuraea jabiensis]MBB5778217.1 hypothetical protein [Nonomuraea jabiensis]
MTERRLRVRVRRAAMATVLTALAMTGPAPAGARGRYDFAAVGVVIWSDPRRDAILVGFGYPGQGFESDWSEERGHYQCDDYFDSILWHHGRNAATGIVGWVPACNLVDAD